MELNLTVLSNKDVSSTVETKQMRLSKHAETMVFQMFTKNVYSNPIGTIVREITSNSFDSHVEANVTHLPVIIRKSYDKETNHHYISFIDYGVGMSPERIDNIYSVYFESTKRENNNEIGGFGIGGKSVLSYRRIINSITGEYDNSFYVITIFNNIKYYYCIYEGKSSPEIVLLHQESTTESNGTEIKVPILESDIIKFERELLQQLYYFENIIFEGFNESKFVTNDYTIIKGKNYLFRGKNNIRYVHVCLGRVCYPINYDVLELNEELYRIPVAIKLNVGDVDVTVSRESLEYSEKTVLLLKNRLTEVRNEILNILISKSNDVRTLEDYFEYRNNFGTIKMPNNEIINLSQYLSLNKITYLNYDESFVTTKSFVELFNVLFNNLIFGKKRRQKHLPNKFTGEYRDLLNNNNIFYCENEFKRINNVHKQLNGDFDVFSIIEKKNIFGDIKTLNIKEDKLFSIQNELFEVIKKYSRKYANIQTKSHNIVKAKSKRNIPIKFFIGGKTVVKEVDLDLMNKLKIRVFYGNNEDKENLYKCKKIAIQLFGDSHVNNYSYSEKSNCFTHKSKNGILFILISKNNEKLINNKNIIHIKHFKLFLNRKHDLIKDIIISQNIIREYKQIDEIFKSKSISCVSNEIYNKVIKLNEHLVKYDEINQKYDYFYYLDYLKVIMDINLDNQNNEAMKIIKELIKLGEKNKKYLNYIKMPFNNIDSDDIFWNLIKKILVIK
jgi:hypothetical protein